ncbi:Hypothetical protein EIN_501500, partial [Entamoeba invadens IP1]
FGSHLTVHFNYFIHFTLSLGQLKKVWFFTNIKVKYIIFCYKFKNSRRVKNKKLFKQTTINQINFNLYKIFNLNTKMSFCCYLLSIQHNSTIKKI